MRHLFLVLGGAVAAAVIWTPSSASAHASLESSNPVQDATVQTMPAQVSLTLTEPVQRPSQIEVTAPDGTRVNSRAVTVLDDTVTSVIDQPSVAGTYRMTYSIVSVDNHTVTGAINFEVLTSSKPAAPATTPSASAPTPTEPAAPASPTAPAGPSSQTQVLPDSGGSTTTRDADHHRRVLSGHYDGPRASPTSRPQIGWLRGRGITHLPPSAFRH